MVKSWIIVTGGAGYIGKHLVIKCLQRGYGCIIIDNLSTSEPFSCDKLRSLAGIIYRENEDVMSNGNGNGNELLKHYQIDIRDYIELESYASNTKHGQRSSKQDNMRNIRRLYAKGHGLEAIQEKLGLSIDIVYEATVEDRKKEKEERNNKILELYLRAQNTEEKITEQINKIYEDRESLRLKISQN